MADRIVKGKLSDKERAQMYRNRHIERVREANSKRMKQVRVKQKAEQEQDPVKKLEYRRKEALRKKLYRAKKKKSTLTEDNSSNTGNPRKRGSFKSPQSFGKAVQRSFRSLPKSPSKKQAVISKLAIQAGLNLNVDNADKRQSLDRNKTLQDVVINFYFHPDIVYTSPGMKDEITTWENGKKQKLRKYYLTMFLREVYTIFQEHNPDVDVGFSTFCKLRPSNVLLLHETPADQCKCLICENLLLKLSCLKISYGSTFWKESLCDDKINSQCWQGKCNACSDGQKITTNVDAAFEVTWKEWGKTQGKLKCSLKEGCAGEVLNILQEMFVIAARHINTKRIQAAEFQHDKGKENSRILQMDFAMNYSCEYQNEVQSALWSRGSITLFTAAAMSNGSCRTYLICSNTKEKEKNTVKAFIHRLYEELEPNSTENIGLTEIIWTDGPSSEFKNRYMCLFLQELSDHYKKQFQWKYFATSHGKGVVDGIGGRAKSLVRNAVMSKKASAPVVQTAEDFAALVRILMPSTKVILMQDNDIPRNYTWNNATEVPGIKSVHVVMANPNSELLQLRLNAMTPFGDVPQSQQTTSFAINVGDWVVVKYDEEHYPGEVTQVIGTDVEVSVMMKASAKHWKWPNAVDKVFYVQDNVMSKIQPPEVVNSRGFFHFKELV